LFLYSSNSQCKNWAAYVQQTCTSCLTVRGEPESHYAAETCVRLLHFFLLPCLPPAALLKYDPAASLLNVGMDVTFHSNSAQAVVSAATWWHCRKGTDARGCMHALCSTQQRSLSSTCVGTRQ
jgi:hypothetical protein